MDRTACDRDAAPGGATPFDRRGVERSRHAGGCSFATSLERHGAPGAPGPEALARGLGPPADGDALPGRTSWLDDGLSELRRRGRAGERLP